MHHPQPAKVPSEPCRLEPFLPCFSSTAIDTRVATAVTWRQSQVECWGSPVTAWLAGAEKGSMLRALCGTTDSYVLLCLSVQDLECGFLMLPR